MPGNADVTLEQSLAISDPGERDREHHTRVDRLVIWVGNITAWLFPILIVAICTQVVIRKLGMNQAWLDDAQWWLYGFAMTVGFGYAITTQSHVRVDILHQNFSPAKKARTEVFGLGWLLLSFLLIMADMLFHYAWASFLAREGSDSPNGLHGLYLLKMSLPLIFMMCAAATASMLTRHLKTLTDLQLWTFLIGCFPAAWFAAERCIYYVLWWVVRFSNPEIRVRRISREPLLEPTMWYGLALVLILIAISYLRNRRQAT